MISSFFIKRPVLSNVLAIIMMILGGVALLKLPITQYPPITPPTVQVTTFYPGATSQTLVDKVALPIEQKVNGVEKMLYMSSNSNSDGHYTLTVTFEIGTDPNLAQILVENRVNSALAFLPPAVQTQGVVTKKVSTSILELITLTSCDQHFDSLFLNNYATIHLQNELIRLPGIADVKVLGSGKYSMRIWLHPDQMKERGLIPNDVITALQNQNVDLAIGQIGSPPASANQDFQLSITSNGALNTPEEFEEVIVKSEKANGGKITRLKDIARIEQGAQSYNQFFRYNGSAAGGIAIYQLPGSNAIKTAEKVREKMKALAEEFPQGVQYQIPFDSTTIVKESIHEVFKTLFEAGALVLLVILLFVQDWRASLVPATTVPVAVIGAFGAMAILGFTINTISLFAVVLSIGIVVDDAIVIVEGVAQNLERGMSPEKASIAAMNSLLGPIVGITLVLMSVFLPAAFMPGMTGQMYRQFALVIASTALISAIIAISLNPTQCTLWLRPRDPSKKLSWVFRLFNAFYHPLEAWYAQQITTLVNHSHLVMTLGLLLIVATGWGFSQIPTGFMPAEDQGYLILAANLPNASTLQRTENSLEHLATKIRHLRAVEGTVVAGGVSPLDSNQGVIYILLKEWKQRGPRGSLEQIYEDIEQLSKSDLSLASELMIPSAIQGLGVGEGFQMELTLVDGSFNYQKLQETVSRILQRAEQSPILEHVSSSFRANVPQINLTVDRRRVVTYGASIQDVFSTLQTYLGSTYVNQYNRYGHTFDVFAQADTNFRATPEQMKNYYVPGGSNNASDADTPQDQNSTGTVDPRPMIPLGSLVDVTPSYGPSVISLYNIYPAATIRGVPAPGHSSGEALAALGKIAHQSLDPGMRSYWTGMAFEEKLANAASFLIFGLSILLVYLVLAGQYEHWITPIAVILAVPLSLLGTALALLGTGVVNNIYVQIGLVLLIALSAKNAILVVEMAREYRATGKSIQTAAIMAAKNRFRPILMTSITFIFGVLPLVFATGAGSNARRCLGIAVASGMLASTCLAVVLVPTFYTVLESYAASRKEKKLLHEA